MRLICDPTPIPPPSHHPDWQPTYRVYDEETGRTACHVTNSTEGLQLCARVGAASSYASRPHDGDLWAFEDAPDGATRLFDTGNGETIAIISERWLAMTLAEAHNVALNDLTDPLSVPLWRAEVDTQGGPPRVLGYWRAAREVALATLAEVARRWMNQGLTADIKEVEFIDLTAADLAAVREDIANLEKLEEMRIQLDLDHEAARGRLARYGYRHRVL